MALDAGLRNEIVALLVTHPMFQDENGWRASLLSAGLEGQLPYLDLHGVPYNVITQLVNRLDLHGTLSDGRPALVALLQAAAGQVGKDRQAHIRNLCERISAPPEVDLAACPYRGLEVFREQDANVFFGRADVAATLQQMVAQQPLTALIGASGSGKSSVVYAGLLPLLRKQPGYLIATFRPGAEPFRAVAAAILPLLEPNLTETDRLIELRKLADALTQAQLSLADILERIRQKAPPAAHLLLFADQFEELYTLCPAGASRQRFLDGMLQTSEVFKTSEVSWLLTLRADFLSQVLDYGPLAKMLDTYPPKLLGRMTEEQLRAAIEQPALKAGVTLEAGLSDHILREVGQEPGNLPLLEFALQALWQRMTGRCLTHAAYEAIGGVNQALTRHADAVLAEFATPEQQAQVRRIMVQLVSPGAGTEDTRQAATRDQVKDWDVVQRLADKRLVVTGRAADSNVETVEVVHEALIRHWQPLRNWMQADRVFRVWQNNLRQAIADWEKAGQDDGALLRGARLADAEEKLAQFADALSDAEKAYITASVALRQQELEARERARREKEQMRRRVTFGLVAGLTVALVLTGVSAIQWRRAQKNAQELRQQTILAQAEAQRAEQEKNRAEEQKNTALRTQSLFLADLARQQNERGNYGGALLLALEALPKSMAQPDRPYVLEAEFQLHHAAMRLRERLVLKGDNAKFSPDEKRILTTDENVGRVWDATTGKEIATLIGHLKGYVWSAVFSPDGTRIVTASEDQTARVWDVSTGQELATLTGHTGWVRSAVFDFDGTRIVTASHDGTARVWDAATGKELVTLIGHEAEVLSATFSPDGTRIVTASADRTVQVWEAVTGKELARLTGHTGSVTSAVFSPDGTRIVTTSEDNTARVWDVSTALDTGAVTVKEVAALTGHEAWVYSAVFSPDGTRIVTASADKTARVWEAVTGRVVATLTGHTAGVFSVAFSLDGTRIVTASNDQTARVWDVSTALNTGVATGAAVATLTGHEGWVYSAAFSPDGTQIVTASADTTARVWDAVTGDEMARLTRHRGNVTFAVFSPDGTRIVTASADATARVWDAATGEEVTTLAGHENSVWSAAFSPDGTRIVTVSADATARVWDAITTSQDIMILISHSQIVSSAAFSPDGLRIVTAARDNTVRVWDAATGKYLAMLAAHQDAVSSVSFSPDGARIATASWDNTARVWDFLMILKTKRASSKSLLTLNGHTRDVESAAFSANGVWLVTASDDNTARVWDTVTGKTLTTLIGHTDTVRSATFSPNDNWIATASDDKTARVWDTATSQTLVTLTGHTDAVSSVAFSPDGTRIVTASYDQTAKVWESATGKTMVTLIGHEGDVNSAAFSPDGTRIVTASDDKTARVWDAVTGKEIALLTGHEDNINSAVFSPDGMSIATASADKTARVWRIFRTTQELIDYANRIVPRRLTPEERKQYFLE